MTIGIYSLYWEEPDLIYIGQSQNIEKRKQWHLNMLKQGKHTNYKVQDTYYLYGEPEFTLLEVCTSKELDSLEIYYTKEFNSILKGLNLIEAGTSTGFGCFCSSSKYTKAQILEVFNRLVFSLDTHIKISKDLNVGIGTIDSISTKTQHTWLEEEFPENYLIMQENRVKRKALNSSGTILDKYGVTLEFIDPEGIHYQVGNITGFCKTHPILKSNHIASQKGLSRLANNTAKTYKGWRIHEPLLQR